MPKKVKSRTVTVTLKNRYGLHARPAAMFVELCRQFQCSILVRKEDLEVDGKNILEIMTLAAESGSTLVITTNGKDAAAAAEAIVKLVEGNFEENE